MEGQEIDKKDGRMFCPECGKQIPGDSVYCEFCGSKIPKEALAVVRKPEQQKTSQDFLSFCKKYKKTIGGAAAVLFLIIVSGILLGQRQTTAKPTLFYIKDNSLYGQEPVKKEEPSEYSTEYLEKWSSRSGGGLLDGRIETDGRIAGTGPAYSDSGKYLYYLDQRSGDSFSLNRTDIKKNDTKTLDNGVLEFLAGSVDGVLYRKENNALYYYDGSRKTKITAQSEAYLVSEKGDKVVWTTTEDGVRDVYLQELYGKSEPLRLERNARLLNAASDLGTVLVQKEDTVYRISSQGKKEKLVQNISEALQADAAKSSFYYIRREEDSEVSGYQELYYFDKGKSILVDDSFGKLIWQGDGVILYTRSGDEKNSFAVWQGKSEDLGREAALPGQIKVSDGMLYFLGPDEAAETGGRPVYELCAVNLAGKDGDRVTALDRGVSEIACIYAGNAYYFKDTADGIGDLYKAGELVAYDTAIGSVAGVPGGSGVFCIADASSSKRRGTLTLLENNSMENVADNVLAYSALSDKATVILSDYSRDRSRGNLLLFDGREITTLAEDIWGYYGLGNSGICR